MVKLNNNLSLKAALTKVRQYSCIEPKQIDSEEEREKLQAAIKLIASLSEYENIGICANNYQEGFAALSNYLKALKYQYNFNLKEVEKINQPIYIKFNTQKMSYYVDNYKGKYRGVLISCTGDCEEIVGTYGHFPLDLFP